MLLCLFFSRRFWPHFWAQFLGAFNDNVFKNAVIILITYRSLTLWGLGTEQLVAFAGAVGFLPFFFIVAFAGEIADKWPKNKLVLAIKMGEFLVMALGVVGLLLDSLPVLLTTALLMGAQSTLFGPVKYSILAELVPEERLVDSNALIGMGTFLAILLGTLVGGFLAAWQWQGMVTVCVLVLMIAALGVLCAWRIPPLEARAPQLKLHHGVFRPLQDILQITARNRAVFLAILGTSWFWFFGATMLALFPVLVKENLKMGETVVTLFLGLFSVGVALGAGLSSKVGHSSVKKWIIPMSAFFMGLMALDLYCASTAFTRVGTRGLKGWMSNPGQWRIMLDLILLSMSGGLFIVPLQTFIQNNSPAEVRSRVLAGNTFYNTLFMVASGTMLVGIYALGATPAQALVVLGVLGLIVSAVALKLRTQLS